ncbi:MAG: hypothetical protein WCE81_06060 [Halobacteriota archaeon]
MNSEGHLKKAQEIYDDIMILKEHDGDAHVSSIVELAYGCAFHYLAYGCDRRAGTHVDIHAGLPRLLSSTGDDAIADLFRELDVIRHGRWYGGKGNGATIARVLEIVDMIIQWSQRR